MTTTLIAFFAALASLVLMQVRPRRTPVLQEAVARRHTKANRLR